ncbi:MAG TPA: DUF1236 domain-containing protein [Xanthobacteraceae bacterium]|nr:DUF1236 domain-containing protein [Xanthobacteraceae bacterium]
MHITRFAALAAGLLLSFPAWAQTTVITEQPATAVIAPAPQVTLTPAQRTVIYRTIVQQQAAPAQVVEERTVTTAPVQVGTRVPATSQLYTIPETVAVQVPAVKAYRYMYVNHRVVLVDPATSTVVGEIAE